MRKRSAVRHFFLLLGVLVSGTAVASEPVQAEPLSCRRILDTIISQLPSEKVVLKGSINVRKMRGVVVKELGYEMVSEWGGKPPEVSFVIKDAFGGILEQMKMIRAESGPVFEYRLADSATNTPLPLMSAGIQGSDISWTDLTLSFLWWTNGTITGTEDVIERPCHVIDIKAPEGEKGQYSKVRLWVEKQAFLLLKADGYDARGETLRTLWVKSFKKIGDRWMLKDMEIQSYPSNHRTKLSVDDFSVKSAGLTTGQQ